MRRARARAAERRALRSTSGKLALASFFSSLSSAGTARPPPSGAAARNLSPSLADRPENRSASAPVPFSHLAASFAQPAIAI